jgi:hypothetical protein
LLQAQVAEATEEKQKSMEKYDVLNLQYNRIVSEYETQIKRLNFEISKSKEDLSLLNTEYDNYRVRAQHAFKKQKAPSNSGCVDGDSVDDNRNHKLVEECKLLKNTIEQLQDKFNLCR